jgi:hypothetical protein
MAARYTFTCNLCDLTLAAWTDGNPYIEHPPGTRQHFYHPSDKQQIADIAKSILGREPTEDDCDSILRNYAGNEPDHVCRECHQVNRIDLRKDTRACRHCGATIVEKVLDLGGTKCVRCEGVFSNGAPTVIS